MSEKRGLYNKYNVTKADGTPIDPHAVYIVLRIDDGEYLEACRKGVWAFAQDVMYKNTKLGQDLLDLLDTLEGANEKRVYRISLESLEGDMVCDDEESAIKTAKEMLSELGESDCIVITAETMTQDEIDNMPEFTGW